MAVGLIECVLASCAPCVLSPRSRPYGAGMADITARSLELFIAYAEDAGNWAGTPLIGGNVGGSPEDRGNLTQLKQAGLITTFSHENRGDVWIDFTEEGKALAAEHGVDLSWIDGRS